jgi:hypothetical protein
MTLPPLYANMSMDFPGSPQARSKGMALSSYQLQHHDIDAYEFLSEIEMEMYTDTFLTNFSLNNTNYLNRKRLLSIRMQDFPKMGITQYDHQKILYDHIQHALEYEFNSPVRKMQVRTKMEERFPDRNFAKPVKISKLRPEDLHIPHRELKKVGHAQHNTISSRRRRSFDKNVWQCISHLRTAEAISSEVANSLRDGNPEAAERIEKKHNDRRRRRSFEHNHSGTEFGNRALSADMLQKELHILHQEHIKRIKRVVNCEESHIMFIHERTHDMLLVTEHRVWYRLPLGFSIPGQCAETGAAVITNNAYDDSLFNSNLDEKLGIKSKQIMAYPLRGNRGAGSIIGILMCTNKIDGNEFDSNDQDAVATIATNISDDLHTKFHELTTIADIMYGSAVLVNAHGGVLGQRRGSTMSASTLQKKTAATLGHQQRVYDPNNEEQGIHSVHEKNVMHY